MWNDRTRLLIKNQGIDKLDNSNIMVVGLGGVGGYVAYLLVRAGVGNITLVDFDTVDESNINRQIVATTKTLGMSKTDVMRDILLDINPKCNIETICQRISKDNVSKIVSKSFDYVVDAIDSLSNKVELIAFCKNNSINIVSAMGAGNRICIPNFRVEDIFKTSNDGLAKCLRKKLREREISHLDVVCCDTPQEKFDSQSVEKAGKQIGSISYFPCMCGCVLAGFIIKKLLEN